MPIHLRFKLAGIALTLGGLTAATCHLLGFEASAEVSQMAKYACLAEWIHLILFGSLLTILLGWCEQYSVQSANSGFTGFAAFMCLFLGIICGDLLHCALEFSVFPVLGSMVPYALPGIAEATYRSAALGSLIWAGQALMFLGSVATLLSVWRSRSQPFWAAAPLTVAAMLLGLGLFPSLSSSIRAVSLPALYVSVALRGVLLICGRGAITETPVLTKAAAQ